MLEIIPSLSVLHGKCVRLAQGNYDTATTYSENPLEVAERFENHGIKRLHLIDLDGAKQGVVKNYETLQLIAQYTKLNIDFGGGIQTDGDLIKCFEYGCQSVTIGSLAVKNKTTFASWISSFGRSKIVLSADVKGGKISVLGRQENTQIDFLEHIDYFYNRGLLYLKCSDVERDGTMQGVSVELYKSVLAQFPDLRVLASGGVNSIDDLKRLADAGVYGVIIGKAIYENKITLKDIEKYIAQPA